MNRSANWMGWTLQLIFGAILGSALGMSVVSRRYGGASWMIPDAIPIFVTGCGLLIGAISSHWGDRLWMGDNYILFPPDGPDQNWMSTAISIVIGLAGCACISFALLLHFGIFL
jgi:hypothetical protein